MRLQRFDRGIVTRQFSFGERGMNFVVTDLMQQHRRPAFATAQLWNQVVQALPRLWWDGPLAKGAYRNVMHIEILPFLRPEDTANIDTDNVGMVN